MSKRSFRLGRWQDPIGAREDVSYELCTHTCCSYVSVISESYAGGVSQEDCSVEEEASKECIEYGERLDSLNKLLEENTPKLLQAKSIMEEMRDIKIKPSKSVPGVDSPALKAAMESAKAISEKSGADSAEAKVAWSEVEEIASGNYSNALGGMLNDECLIETIEACEAIEELQRVLNLKKSTSRYSG